MSWDSSNRGWNLNPNHGDDDSDYEDYDNGDCDYDVDGGGDDDDDDDDSIESDLLHRRNIISGLHASSLWDLELTDKLRATPVTMESLLPDLENVTVALQSNRSLVTISISGGILAASPIEESDQSRLYWSLANLPTLHRMTVYRGAGSYTAIHTRVLADALSDTSNGLESLVLSGFKD
jgi:hypothetical protein